MILGLAEGSIQLVPDGTILIHIVLILVMVGILNRTLFQPIHRILGQRERLGRGTLAEASEILRAISQDLAAYETALRTARSEGYRLAEVKRSEEFRDREVQLTLRESEIAKLVEAEKAVIEQQGHEVKRAVAAEAEMLAFEIRSQIMKAVVDLGEGR